MNNTNKNSRRVISPKQRKRKGKIGESNVCKLLTEWTGVKFNSTPASGALRWHKDNRITGDVVSPPDFDFCFSVEVKVRKKLDLRIKTGGEFKAGYILKTFWQQSCADASRVDKIPMVFCRQDNMPKFDYYVILDCFFMDILGKVDLDAYIHNPMVGYHTDGFCVWSSKFLLSLPYQTLSDAIRQYHPTYYPSY